MREPRFKIYNNTTELVEAFTEYFKLLILKKEGSFNVALSGGSTPKSWFDYLANYKKDPIHWSNVHMYWGDERCVPPDNSESNYGMTKNHLLDHIDIPQDNIHRIQGELPPQEAAHMYSHLLKVNLPKAVYPVFDLVILGMGDDGHTASIFPHEISLWNASDFCVVATHPVSGQKRVSLSGNVINAAQHVAFMVTGESKADKFDDIFHEKPGSSRFPAFHVAPNKGQLTWFLDKAAAQHILI